MALSLGGSGPTDGGEKAARLPRWTRQEILVLIQGKRVAENRVRRGRGEFGSGQVEPKWASVAAYCRKHGVNRGPVQCRKRWSNLAGDFKKIKEWELRSGGGAESFWAMRNDLRRERKLPGFFDREVYEILNGSGGGRGEEADVGAGGGLSLELAPPPPPLPEDKPEAVFDSGRSAAVDDGMFSEFEQPGRSPDPGQDCPHPPVPISAVEEEQFQTIPQGSPDAGANCENRAEGEFETEHERNKRKRNEDDYEQKMSNYEQRVIEALEKSGKLLTSHLESQNINIRLDREQRNRHVNRLIGVLGNLADAIGRIADKL